MIRDNYLDINKLVQDKRIFKLFRAVEAHGGVLRFVGGAVRDALAGGEGFDLDLATDLEPDELVEACNDNGIKTVPIGIKFGTVGVLVGDKVLEVTSLRRDVKSDGRRAEVEFTTDWEIDASRRDLTINAVYADEKGNVFDYYDGISDLEKGIVRFIGSPAQRIKEDYLRILRFFRFYAIYGKAPIDEKALKACIEQREGLKNLSIERVRDELAKILVTDRVIETLKIMYDNEILSYVFPKSENLDKLDFLIRLVERLKLPRDVMRRIFVLYAPDKEMAEYLAGRLKLSRKDRQNLVSWAENQVDLKDYENAKGLRRLVYCFGKGFARDKLLLQAALEMKEMPHIEDVLKNIETMAVPVFPLRGKDIMQQGVEDNRQIGKILEKLEKIWIESDFQLSRESLLAKISDKV